MSHPAKDMTYAELITHVSYSPETGEFTRKTTKSSRWAGKTAGTINNHGYVAIKIVDSSFQAHRLAWLYVNKSMPNGFVDHINRVKTDNRIANLRVVTPSENTENQTVMRSTNTSGHRGISWNKSIKKWHAKIRARNIQYNLGFYLNIQDAINAYLAGVEKYHTHNPLNRAAA